MSYNIDTFKLKSVVDLKIPVDAFYIHEEKDLHPERINEDDGTVVFECSCGSWLKGSVEDGIFIVGSMNISGEFSGHFMYDVLVPALKESTGSLVASCVWEGGDGINRIKVENGVVTWEDIEI